MPIGFINHKVYTQTADETTVMSLSFSTFILEYTISQKPFLGKFMVEVPQL